MSTDWSKVISSFQYEVSSWGGGEQHVRLTSLDLTKPIVHYHHVKSTEDLMETLLVGSAVKEFQLTNTHLVVPYLPYSRQDRACRIGEGQYGKLALELLNTFPAVRRITFDMHNPDILPDDWENVPHIQLMRDTYTSMEFNNSILIVAPDKGASVRAKEVADFLRRLNYQTTFVVCDKFRGSDGKVTIKFPLALSPIDSDILVVDDICDGGRTFIELAKVLPQTTGKKILSVTHGIFSRGIEPLLEAYDEVLCFHTWDKAAHIPSSVTVVR